MYKMYIDSTTRFEKEVVLKKVENSEEVEMGRKFGDIDMVVSIKELLEENNLSVSDIDEVTPNLGPGSFTGLKMGVTIANIINWANGKKTIKELYLPNYGSEPNITKKKFN